MNITSYTREEIEAGIQKGRERHRDTNSEIRLLFAPEVINSDNFECACDIYSRIDMSNYDTVVVVESHKQTLDKKLPMASNRYFETPLGTVPADDYIRNEFCDEDDDFYIHDEAFDKDISLFQQLMFLQTLSDDFSAVSIQIADNNPSIVRELAYVLEEVLASRNALLVFCCELGQEFRDEFRKIKGMVDAENHSGLLNYLGRASSNMKGDTAFLTGIIVAGKWKLGLNFIGLELEEYCRSLLTAYADRQRVFFS